MNYNFDKIIDRSNNNAAKVLEAYLHFGTNDVLPLWIADMDFATAAPIIDAIKARADQGIFGYTNRPDEYFEAYANWQEKRNNWRPDPSYMAFAPGVIPGLNMLLKQLTEKGDKIIIQPPVYHPFSDVVHNLERTLICSELKKDENGIYQMDFEDFEGKISNDDVKYFILCNPHNPVGRSWKREELERIGNMCLKHNVKIISDEIHSDLMLFGSKHTPMASISKEIADITITCIAPSKTFNLAGLQSSTIVFPEHKMQNDYITQLKKDDIARNNCFSLVAAIAAYTQGEEWLSQLIPYIQENMKYVKDFCDKNLPQIKVYLPEATYMLWVDFSGLGLSDDELHKFLVEKAGIALNPGVEFGLGGSGYSRINTATPRANLERAMKQLKNAVDQL